MTIIKSCNALTRSEFRVSELLVAGFQNKHIADKLGISENTVKVHMRTIFKKLGVTNRTAASMLIMQTKSAGQIEIPVEKIEKKENQMYYLLTPAEWEAVKERVPSNWFPSVRTIELQGV